MILSNSKPLRMHKHIHTHYSEYIIAAELFCNVLSCLSGHLLVRLYKEESSSSVSGLLLSHVRSLVECQSYTCEKPLL